MKTRIHIKFPKPRNPWAAVRTRPGAGRHARTPAGCRQQLQRDLRSELARLAKERTSP